MWLLNHAEEVLHAPKYKRARQYGPEVQQALFLAWHTANRICAEHFLPFLPILLESLERLEHLHLNQKCRKGAAKAERPLSSQRKRGRLNFQVSFELLAAGVASRRLMLSW